LKRPFLNITQLSIAFSQQEKTISAVKNLDLVLNEGDVMAIVGESGSGKSVSMLALLKLLNQNAQIKGQANFFLHEEKQIDLIKASPSEIKAIRGKHIGMIFQEPMSSLNPSMRCGNQVAESFVLHENLTKGEAKKQTLALFEKVQLDNPDRIFNSYPHQISGGQKQRVMIAMALAAKPKLLICDEPTTALDVTVQHAILELLAQLKAEYQLSMIFISHDLNLVKKIANKVIVMKEGNMVESGTINEIFETPNAAYTKGLLACRPTLNTNTHRLPTVKDFIENTHIENRVKTESIISEIPFFEINNLEVWFPNNTNIWGKTTSWTKAVDGVDFNIYQGESLGILGESGCGKTTLGRALLKLTPSTKGNILWKNKAFSSMSKADLKDFRKSVQMIFQDPYSSLNPMMRIGDAIVEPMIYYNLGQNKAEMQQKAIHLLEIVGLKPDHYRNYPHQLSGGQRQRVGIARALAVSPEFIVCDESVSALDVSVQAQVINLLLDLKEQFGLTYLFISHDMSLVKYFCDRIGVMNGGKFIETQKSNDLFLHPKESYTRGLISYEGS
jgi:peptide/nickel transport system ATP-binding protein